MEMEMEMSVGWQVHKLCGNKTLNLDTVRSTKHSKFRGPMILNADLKADMKRSVRS